MKPTFAPSDDLRTLASAAAEGRLTAEEMARLESLVLASPAALRYYTEFAHQHAALTWTVASTSTETPTLPKPPVRRSLLPWAVAVAAGVIAAVGWFAVPGTAAAPKPFATLISARDCTWVGGTLPTEEGTRLAAGRLRLSEGVAKIVFDAGTELRIEGPAELELVNGTRCVLARGRAVAKVPPPAIGFVIDTPTAEITDLGTEFGVNVADGTAAEVQVFDGLVDAKDRRSGTVERLTTGKNVRFAADGYAPFDPNAIPPEPRVATLPPGGRYVTTTTAQGQGKDKYVQPLVPSQHMSDVLILVKNSKDPKPDYLRKGLIGMDLSGLAGGKVTDARLELTMVPTGMGYAAELPDSTFAIYGLTDESLDHWNPETVRWATAPANRTGGAAVDPKKTVKLGTFQVPQGIQSGVKSIDGPALVEFLNRDTNGLATFILVRETPGSGKGDLVHGFANRKHPTLPPPTLRMTVVNK